MVKIVLIVPNTKIFENEACVPNTLNWRPAVIDNEFRLIFELLKGGANYEFSGKYKIKWVNRFSYIFHNIFLVSAPNSYVYYINTKRCHPHWERWKLWGNCRISISMQKIWNEFTIQIRNRKYQTKCN